MWLQHPKVCKNVSSVFDSFPEGAADAAHESLGDLTPQFKPQTLSAK